MAAGLYCGYSEHAEERGVLHAYFTEEPSRRDYTPIQTDNTIPEPEMELSTSSSICLNTLFPDSVETTYEEETYTPVLPLNIETSITTSSPSTESQTNKKISEDTFTPPFCKVAPQPDYPTAMKSTRRRGEVRMRIHINQEGTPTAVDILSSTHIAFAQATQHCILKRWKFVPAYQNGKSIPSVANISIHFSP